MCLVCVCLGFGHRCSRDDRLAKLPSEEEEGEKEEEEEEEEEDSGAEADCKMAKGIEGACSRLIHSNGAKAMLQNECEVT